MKLIQSTDKTILCAAASCLLLMGGALSGAEPPAPASVTLPPVVAKVNGVEIGIDQFWGRILNTAGTAVLTSLVDEILLEQEADKVLGLAAKKGKVSSASKKFNKEIQERFQTFRKQFDDEKSFQAQLIASGITVEDINKQLRLDLIKEKLLEDKTKSNPAEIKSYFDQNQDRLAVPEMAHLKHILVSTEQEARDLLLALRVGADFELMARAKSLDQATKDRGGDLGFFAQGMLIPQLQERAFALEPEGVDIVRTNQGFHVIKVVEKRPAKQAVWDQETRENIEKLLKQAKFNQEYPKYIQGLRSQADIQVLLNR